MDLWVREARLFKYGSGTGSNFSRLRGEGEKLSGGGRSSGLMSFLKIGDRAAGAIKSGGTTRRSHDGTVSSSTFFRREATPALRKYFCARTSEATCDQNSGTSTFSSRNTTEPSGLRISLVVSRKSMAA